MFSRNYKSLVLVGLASTVLIVKSAHANGYGENGSWQFQTSADRVNRSQILDQITKYQATKGITNVNNVTNNYGDTIYERYVNCSNAADSAANRDSNTVTNGVGTASVNGSTTLSSPASANDSTTNTGRTLPGGTANLNNTQSNTGQLNSSISGSSATGGSPSASGTNNGGTQSLASNQSNTGSQTASVTGSTACAGPIMNGQLN